MFPNFSSARKTVADIKQTFEQKKDSPLPSLPLAPTSAPSLALPQSPPPALPSAPTLLSSPPPAQPATPQLSPKPSFLANMSPSKELAQAQKAVQPSIDAVVETAKNIVPEALKRPSQPHRPSWIGPKISRAPSPSASTNMKHPVTIEFTSPGLQPPVFVGTSLSDPEWEPVEMQAVWDDKGEWKFTKTFQAEEGEYQYKLRLGPGDWWVCDDSKPKVDDGAGNQNNQVIVKPEPKPVDPAPAPPVSVPEIKPEVKPEVAAPAAPPTPVSVPEIKQEVKSIFQHAAEVVAPVFPTVNVPEIKEPEHDRKDSVLPIPLMQHESFQDTHQGSVDKHTAADHLPDPTPASPLFRHESLAPPPLPIDNDSDDIPEDPPLLRHESIAPSSHEQSHSPLFQHETTSIDNKRHHDHEHHRPSHQGGRKHSNDSIPEEADENDPSLVRFPTDHQGIMEHIDRTRKSLHADQCSDGQEHGSKKSSPAGSAVHSVSPSLPSVIEVEDGEEEMEELREEAREVADKNELPPDADVPEVTLPEAVDRPAALMTPPMTPKEQEDDEDDDDDEAIVDTPMNTKAKHVQFKEKAIVAAEAAQEAGTGILAIIVGIAVALFSGALAWFYVKNKNDDVAAAAL